MDHCKELAQNLHKIYFGRTWTLGNLESSLKDVTFEQATSKVGDHNTIAALSFHINYYVDSLATVLEGGARVSEDSESFTHPILKDENDWIELKERVLKDGRRLVELISELPDDILEKDYVEKKWGSYHRNLWGVVEHAHYHLGQINLIKKLL